VGKAAGVGTVIGLLVGNGRTGTGTVDDLVVAGEAEGVASRHW